MTAVDRMRSPLTALGPVLAAPAAVRLGVLLGRPVEAELEGVGVALVAGPDDLVARVEVGSRDSRELGELRIALEDVRVLRTLRTAQGARADLALEGPEVPEVTDDEAGALAREIASATWLGLADAVRTLTGEALDVRVLGADDRDPGGGEARGSAGGGPGRMSYLLLAVRVRDLFQTSLTLVLPAFVAERLEQAVPPTPTVARPIRLPTLVDGRPDAAADLAPDLLKEGALRRVRDVPITITVELGRTVRRVEEIVSIAPGTVLELDRLAGEPLDIYANQEWVARGEVVVVDENFAVRITQVGREPEGPDGKGGFGEGEAAWGPR